MYTAAFNTTVAGKYVLSAEHSTGLIPITVSGGTQMQVLVTVAPAPSYFSTTYAQGAGLSGAVANTESTFTVSMLDMFGNPQQLLPWTSVRPDVLVMNITQQNCVVCETYSSVGVPQTGLFVVQGFSYQLTNAAWYEVDVTLGGLSIQNFPRNFSVTAGSSQAPYCKVLWAGQAAPVAVSSDLNSLLAFASADNATALKRWSVAGVLQSFSVNAFDSSGNWQKKYQDFFDARVVSGPEVVNTTLVSQGTAEGNYGVYSSAFTPTVSGVYSVTVTLNGQSLPFAPVSFVVVPASPVASLSTLSGPLQQAVSRKVYTVTVTLFDQYGNRALVGCGASCVAATFSGVSTSGSFTGEPTVTRMADNLDGSYSFDYVPELVGNYSLAVSLNGATVTAA